MGTEEAGTPNIPMNPPAAEQREAAAGYRERCQIQMNRRVTIRPYEDTDASEMSVAALGNPLADVSPWMPWCHSEYSVADAAATGAKRPETVTPMGQCTTSRSSTRMEPTPGAAASITSTGWTGSPTSVTGSERRSPVGASRRRRCSG